MQQQQIPSPQPISATGTGKVALTYGLIFGGVVSVIDFLYSLYLFLAPPSFLTSLGSALYAMPPVLYNIVYSFILSLPLYILLFVGFLLAGLFASRKSKRVVAGTLAGVWAGVLYLIVDLFFATILLNYLIYFPSITNQFSSPSELASFEGGVLSSAVSYSLGAGLILIGIGALIGALGGLIGRGAGTQTQLYPPYAPNPYAPNPYQAQPPMYANPYPAPYSQPPQPGQPMEPWQIRQPGQPESPYPPNAGS